MADGVITYAAGELHRAAAQHVTTADAAGALARLLAGLHLDPAALGTGASAAVFARAVGVVQKSQAGGAAGEATRRTTIGRDTRATAELGDGLTADSTDVAGSGGPR